MDVHQQIAYIIDAFEGSEFTDDPRDHGGATRYGITRALLSAFHGLKDGALVPIDAVRNLTRDEAIVVGAEMMALRTGLYRIADDRLRFIALDYAFHSGAGQAIKDLQRTLGLLDVDGSFGPHTEAAANAPGDLDLRCEQLVARRLLLMGQDLGHHHDQAVYASDWLSRVGHVLCYRVH